MANVGDLSFFYNAWNLKPGTAIKTADTARSADNLAPRQRRQEAETPDN